jgi:hypothetical protein
MKEHEKGFYMSIQFTLSPSFPLDPSGKRYGGVYTEFSFLPAGVIDVSTFDGIEFRARHTAKNPADGSGVEFALQVAVYGIEHHRYHEKVFPLTPNTTYFEPIKIKFLELKTPKWPGWEAIQYNFNKERVFRIALVIRGKGSAAGQLEFDSMRFFR